MLSEKTLYQIKHNLLLKFKLERIILFGSQARGVSTAKSDVDVLVITKKIDDRFKEMSLMNRALLELDYAFDIILLTESEFERDKQIPGTVARYADSEGIIIYG